MIALSDTAAETQGCVIISVVGVEQAQVAQYHEVAEGMEKVRCAYFVCGARGMFE